ncbi:hypothetical protein LINPERHAP1_LOCUS8172, partial [Linum perenne]
NNSRNPNRQALRHKKRSYPPLHRQQLTPKYPEPPGAISSSRRHEPVATNRSSIGALQLPKSRIEVFGDFWLSPKNVALPSSTDSTSIRNTQNHE